MGVKVRELPPGSGHWYVKVDYHQRRVARCFSSEERANEVAQKITTALDLYGLDALRMFQRPEAPPTPPTVEAYAAKWAAELEPGGLKRSTIISYQSNLKHHIIPDLGTKLLTEIDYATLKSWVCAKAGTTYSTGRFRTTTHETPATQRRYSHDTLRIMVMTMRALMEEAVHEQLLNNNPVKGLAKFYRQRRDHAINRAEVYTTTELYTLEDILQTQRPQFQPDAYELFLCLSRTGMRVGEARGLMTDDLRLEDRTIDIKRNIPSGHNHLEETTKGKTARTVDMGRDLYQALQSMTEQRPPDPSPWLFRAPHGGPMSYDKIYDDWKRAQAIAGIRFRSPHALRHTYASTSLATGEDLAYVAKQLGHANPQITLAIYTHFLPNKRQRKRNALDRTRK